MSAKSSPLVGIVVAILIVGAVASIGYYQVEVAPFQTTSTTSTSSVACTATTCVHISIVSGAASQPSNYTGSTTIFMQYGYSPGIVTVVIGHNNTVYWTNNDTAIHTSTDAGVFDSSCIGDTCPSGAAPLFQFTFTTPGTYVYHCSYHAWMAGEIIVKSG